MKATKWHIAGVGAMGSLLAGRLCDSGHTVNLLLKNIQQLTVYQDNPLMLLNERRVLNYYPDAIDIEHLNDEPIYYLLCCVKAYDITQLLIRLKHRLNEDSIIILIHNGLGVLEEIKQQLPQLRIISGVSTIGAHLEKPFKVRAFLKGKFYLGNAIGEFTTHEIDTVCNVFKDSQLPFQWEDNIHTMMWEKFALNCCINLLTALYSCKNGELLTKVELITTLSNEVSEVMSAYCVPISAATLFQNVIQLLQITAANYSSMYTDVANNKPTELHYLNEHLIYLAKQKAINIPLTIELLKQFYAKFPYLLNP